MKLKRRESDILSSCLKLLKARGIFAMRMNTGSFAREYKGKKRFVKFGLKGCADILAIRRVQFYEGLAYRTEHNPLWIETKAPGGRQSPAQKEFAAMVTAEGHRYLVVHSAEELNTVLG